MSLVFMLIAVGAKADDELAREVDFQIAAQSLPAALIEFSAQSGVQVVTAGERLAKLATAGVSGRHAIGKALQKLLEGTGLKFSPVGQHTVTITGAAAAVEQAGSPPDARYPSATPRSKAEPQEAAELGTVVITGSRLQRTAEGPQEVHVYTRQQIDQSGQTTVAEFLNTLPSVSLGVDAGGQRIYAGGTTVQLRGLPVGTTLILLNGRRVQTSGSQASSGIFDLNNIPLSTVERIEVVADGSSAIYGSDAIAGVVNIILKKNFTGIEAATKYGWADGTDESSGSLAWGLRWGKGSVSIIGSYQARSELDTSERSITASNDYSAFGGPNNNLPACSPGSVFSVDGSNLPGLNAPFAAVPAGFTGAPGIEAFQATAGALNLCPATLGASLIAPSRNAGALLQGEYELGAVVSLFAEIMYSHVQVEQSILRPSLLSLPGLPLFTVSASNPYNPFGTTVAISQSLTSIKRQGQYLDTVFFRPLLGARGFLGSWEWELSARSSEDDTDNPLPQAIVDNAAIQGALNSSDPATALNPFVDAPPGPQAQLQSFYSDGLVKTTGRGQAVNGFARGSVLQLPAGPVAVVLGGEYDRDTLDVNRVNDGFSPPDSRTNFRRQAYAFFGEARVPILANRSSPQAGDRLAVTLAGRYDHYDDFGSTDTPQFGAEWRPIDSLLVRGTYAEAFKAPNLFDLYSPQVPITTIVQDPLRGDEQYQTTLLTGGNPRLDPLTGRSHSFGFVWSSRSISGLQFSVTHWNIDESNSIQPLSATVILNNPDVFPERVIREPAGPGGDPGRVTTLDATAVNFGDIHVAGLDYRFNYRHPSSLGLWTPSLNVAQIYDYTTALVPGAAPTDRVSKASDDNAWAPRWKGTLALGWKLGPYVANVSGRYVGSYQDYGSAREIGDFWLADANFRYAIGSALFSESPWFKGAYVELGGINLLDRSPQFSNFGNGFLGYDPTQGDIRGRFLYAQFGIRL